MFRFQCVSYSIIPLLHWFRINVRCIISWITKKVKCYQFHKPCIVQCSLISEILKYGKWWVVKPMKMVLLYLIDEWNYLQVVHKNYFHSQHLWTKMSKKSSHPKVHSRTCVLKENRSFKIKFMKLFFWQLQVVLWNPYFLWYIWLSCNKLLLQAIKLLGQNMEAQVKFPHHTFQP